MQTTIRCVWGNHATNPDIDDTATHDVSKPGWTIPNATCDHHAEWLRTRGGWIIRPITR